MNRVMAIEPDKRSRKLLKINIKNNGFSDKTSIHNFAVSNKEGSHKIYYAPKPNLTTLNKPVTSVSKHVKGVIKTKTLDQLGVLPNFVKMDIEGFEVEALLGGMDTFNKTEHCKILLEVHPQFYSEEHNFASVLEKLVSIGYRFKYITSAGIACPKLFREKGYFPFVTFKCGEWERGIFKDIRTEDAIDLSTNRYKEFIPELNKATNKIVRAIMLEK
jgi:FkbM family methyltransferase